MRQQSIATRTHVSPSRQAEQNVAVDFVLPQPPCGLPPWPGLTPMPALHLLALIDSRDAGAAGGRTCR